MTRRRAFSLLLLAPLLLPLAILAPTLVGSNFRAVLPARVYRSAQMSPEELAERIERHAIRAIINLRGTDDERRWYREEAEVAERHGVVLHDIDLVPERLPPRPAVVDLLDALEALPKPLLIHCAAGADRTGFASVVARMALGGAALDDAREELSLRHGHVPFGPASEIGRIFDLFETHVREMRTTGDFAAFDHWARTIYVPYVYSARLESERLPSEATTGQRLALALRVTNTSPGPWELSSDVERGVKLGVRLREAGGDWLDYDRHGQLDRTVAPGGVLLLEVDVFAPAKEGAYEIKLDLVDEHVTWFEQQGSVPLVWSLRVVGS